MRNYMKKSITTKSVAAAAMLLASATAQADDFNLYYEAAGTATTAKVEAVSSLDKIIFENGSIKVCKTDGTSATLSQASVSRLFFSTEKTVTAVNGVESDSAENGKESNAVRDLTGRTVGTNGSTTGLSQGVYIINGKKIIVK